jgi:transposase
MEKLRMRCAGIDVHKRSVAVCALIWDGAGEPQKHKRMFGTMTADLREMSTWLQGLGIRAAAMEATGVYWLPVWQVLEQDGFELLLINPEHYKALRGKKSDQKDGERVAEFFQRGLLEGSFIPTPEIRALRDLTRYRTRLAQRRATISNRVQKLLEEANIKLASVASDVLGVSGRAMLKALAGGQSDPAVLADMALGRLRDKLPALHRALDGCMVEHQRLLLRRMLSDLQQVETHLDALGCEIRRRAQPHAATLQRWQQIPGVSETTAWILLAELGPDAGQYPSAKHACSWAGVCPGLNQSGMRRNRGTTRAGNRWLRRALCEAAWAASRTKNTYLSAQFKRLAGRKGVKRALVALANTILTIAYYQLQRQSDYRELGPHYFDGRNKVAAAHRLIRRLEQLGYTVTATKPAA